MVFAVLTFATGLTRHCPGFLPRHSGPRAHPEISTYAQG